MKNTERENMNKHLTVTKTIFLSLLSLSMTSAVAHAASVKMAIVDCRDHAGKTIANLKLRYDVADLQMGASEGFIVSGVRLWIKNSNYSASRKCNKQSKPADELGTYTLVCASGVF